MDETGEGQGEWDLDVLSTGTQNYYIVAQTYPQNLPDFEAGRRFMGELMQRSFDLAAEQGDASA